MTFFKSPLSKIKRANTHIAEIHSLLVNFTNTYLYELNIENDAECGANYLCFDINTSSFPYDDAAAAIGDVVHNLRSSLDHLYYQIILRCGGKPTRWSHFPICDSQDQLVARLKSALKQNEITNPVADLILGSIRPYQKGNRHIWDIHDLNVRDKHEMLTPVIKLTGIWDVHVEDESHTRFGRSEYFISGSCRIRLPDADNRAVVLRNKGHGMAFMIFDEGTPLKGQNVVNTLRSFSEEAARTVEVFELLKPAAYMRNGSPSRFLSM